MGLAKRSKLKYFAQPIPYFANEISKLVDFHIECVPQKKDADTQIKRSIKKCKLEPVDGTDKQKEQIKKLIKAEIANYKGSLAYNRGYIEVKDAEE